LAKLPSARGHMERRSEVAVGQVSNLPPPTETNPRVARPERREEREEAQIISTPFEDSGRATQRSLPSSSPPPSVSPQIDPGGSPDLRKIYRRFAFILIATILILSAGFGAALYFVMKNRPMSVPVAGLVSQPEQGTEMESAKAKEEENRRSDFRKLMIEGAAALADRRLADGTKAYQNALQLFPEDVEAA